MKKNLDFETLDINIEEFDPTIKVYDESAYYIDCDATLQAIIPIEEDYYLLFDQTVFFPEEGGQTCDRGTISFEDTTHNVIDVHIQKANGKEYIFHRISGKSINPNTFSKGTVFHQEIDFDHRYSNMQNHTGEHIFSGIVKMKFGYENVGFHLSDNIVTMDYSGPLSDEDIAEIEHEVNYVIKEDFPVYCTYPTKEELTDLNYRSKIEIDGPVRIVTIPGVDTCACCAPHVYSTCEIGMFVVLSSQSYKGGTRLSVLSGWRALEYTKSNQKLLEELSHDLKLPFEEIPGGVNKLLSDIDTLKREKASLQTELLNMKLTSLPPNGKSICIHVPEADSRVKRDCINNLKSSRSKYVMIMDGSNGHYSFIMGSSDSNCNDVLSNLRTSIDVKGGGKPEMVQGSMDGDIEEIKKKLLDADFSFI